MTEPDAHHHDDYRKKTCTNCGELKFKSEFAWMKGRMQRKAKCKDCSGVTYPTIGEPSLDLKSPEEARRELEVIFSSELEEAYSIQDNFPHCGSTLSALIEVVQPTTLSPWNTIAGLSVSTPPRVFKKYMLYHFDDDHLLPRILRDYEAAKAHRAYTMRTKRAEAKAKEAKRLGGGGRYCQQCGAPIEVTAHARRKFCNGTCRQAYARSNVTENV